MGESIQKQKNKPEIPRNDFHIFWQQGFDTKEYPKKLPIASQTLKFMEMTLILNQFIQTDIKAQRKQYLIHNLVIEDWNPLVAKEDAPIKQLSLDLLINMKRRYSYKLIKRF